MKKFRNAVVIGRFQPFHLGHLELIKTATSLADNLYVLIGSANSSPSTRNPWLVEERKQMVERSLNAEGILLRRVIPIDDYTYNEERWLQEVQSVVSSSGNTVLVCASKDEKYYTDNFPSWSIHSVESHLGIDATTIRTHLFLMNRVPDARLVPVAVAKLIAEHRTQEWWASIVEEAAYIENYKNSWSDTPYPVIFSTVDSVVVCSGHVLMIERGLAPGKGLLALPGGFINPDETLVNAAVRELREETKLKVPVPVLKGCIKNQHVFDDPKRSARGRTITTAFYFHLEPGKLPEVRGSDDAAKAMWVPLGALDPTKIFEDHWHIINYFI
jgi:bifunctional NMN adenylyltransferase/nudix hydrolase